MVASSNSNENNVEIERLYTEYLHSVEHARDALRSDGANSELFRKTDSEVGALRRKIKELLGAATEWDEWE